MGQNPKITITYDGSILIEIEYQINGMICGTYEVLRN